MSQSNSQYEKSEFRDLKKIQFSSIIPSNYSPFKEVNLKDPNEIQYFEEKNTDVVASNFLSGLSKIYNNLMDNKLLSKHHVYVNPVIIFNKNNIKDIFKLKEPIAIKVYSEENHKDKYPDSQLFSTKGDIEQYVKQCLQISNDVEFLVSQPLLIEASKVSINFIKNFVYYVSSDFITVYSIENDDSHTISVNSKAMFECLNLSSEFIYKICFTGGRFFIESIFRKDDERFSFLQKNTLEEYLKNDVTRKTFINGYKNGLHFTEIFSPCVLFGNLKYISDIYNLGFLFGVKNKTQLNNAQLNVLTGSMPKNTKEQFKHFISNALKSEHSESFIKLHNFFLKKEFENKELEEFSNLLYNTANIFDKMQHGFEGNLGSPSFCFTSLCLNIQKFLYLKADNPYPSKYDSYNEQVSLNSKFDKNLLKYDIKGDGFQYRPLHDDFNFIRLQAKSFSVICSYAEGTPEAISFEIYKKDSLETDIKISQYFSSKEFNDFVKAAKGDIYSLSSNAGTGVKYAPLKFINNTLVSEHAGAVIVNEKAFEEHIAKKYIVEK